MMMQLLNVQTPLFRFYTMNNDVSSDTFVISLVNLPEKDKTALRKVLANKTKVIVCGRVVDIKSAV